MLRTLAAVLAAGALIASPAAADDTNCVGEQTFFYACVVTPTVGTGTYTLCVYTGSGTCQPVVVPVPTVTGQADVYCGGLLCFSIDADALCHVSSKIDLCPR